MIFRRFSLKFFAISLLFIFSCQNKNESPCNIDPALVDCIGFPMLGFVITRNGENIFNENMTTIENISVQGTDLENRELSLQSGFIPNEGPVLFFVDLDWDLGGNYTYLITVEESDSFSLSASFIISEGPCCGSIPILENIQINGTEAFVNTETGFYNVTIN
ncbi:hypothetical protein [Maribacter sp. 2308TA10-17]|uniref:hypothetical protein n=1 Tax=Maribacter sp. 2308TA10-17 TaxID=3386276 RepID=UPI0039BC6ED0